MSEPRVVRPLVSPEWLQDNLANPGIQVIENAWIPESYLKGHIPGAVCMSCHPHIKHFDGEEKTQHVLRAGEFANLCLALGLRRDRHYILYDDYHGLFAARFWAVCRRYGVDNISVLDGGWHGWVDQGRRISTRITEAVPGTDIEIAQRPTLFVEQEELQRIHEEEGIQIWDTRRAEEFDGSEETDNVRQGHIPGALHLPWTDLLTGEGLEGEPRFLKPEAELLSCLSSLGLDRNKTIITYCQSGIRAAFCLFVLDRLGFRQHRLYDASMGEWSNLPHTPLAIPPTSEAT